MLCWVSNAAWAVTEQTYFGAADASAIVFIDDSHFVIADDESNVLLIYKTDGSAKPVSKCDLNTFLRITPESAEADIEAAAKIGDRIYWITSHGRSKSGKIRPNRYRFFCTQIVKGKTQTPQLIPIGIPCVNLVQQMLLQPWQVQKQLIKATRFDEKLSKKERERLSPKEEGFNIEGMMYYPPGKSLLIGLRNPLFEDSKGRDNAIVLELKNPAEVIDSREEAEFGKFIHFPLGGNAIRGMEYSRFDNNYYILGGAAGKGSSPALYSWDGDPEVVPQKLYQWSVRDSYFNPEGLVSHPGTGLLWVLSDDGSVEMDIKSQSECLEGELLSNGRCLNKHLKNSEHRSFRIQKKKPATE
jgi:hypothetical protein